MSSTPSTPGAQPAPSLDAPPPPAAALFSPGQITLATLLATPIAGALLANANLRARGKSGVLVMAGAAAVVAAVFAIDAWGAGPLTLLAAPLWTGIAWVLSVAHFGPALATAPARKPHLVALVVVVVWAALAVVGAAGRAFLDLRAPSASEIAGDSVAHGPEERVHFVDGGGRPDAERVARALASTGYFTGQGRMRVVVDREEGELRVSLYVPVDAKPDELERGGVMTTALANALGECVRGRLQSPSRAVLASGRSCPRPSPPPARAPPPPPPAARAATAGAAEPAVP